eukprot:GSChrysophyteH2.ASY1.ANO1.1347.1 assembled CDS
MASDDKSKKSKVKDDFLGSSDSESDSDNERQPKASGLAVNQKYASKFEAEARFKDMQRNKELLADGLIADSDDSDETDEDDDAELLTPAMDVQIMKTINSLRTKDAKIYDSSHQFFDRSADDDDDSSDNSDDDETTRNTKANKKATYKDVIRRQLSDGADLNAEDDVHIAPHERKSLAYDPEQEQIRRAFLKSTEGDASDSSDEEGILTVKSRAEPLMQGEDKDEEAAAAAELAVETKRMIELGPSSSSSATYGSGLADSEPVTDGDVFLANFITKQAWKQDPAMIVHKQNHDNDFEIIDIEENELDEVDRFESKYNFRFEEAGDSAAFAEKKAKEKRQREEELKRLKNLKRKELQERVKKIALVSGSSLEDVGIDPAMLDDEWDPEKHERMMQEQYGDDYYGDDDRDEEGNLGGDDDYDELDAYAPLPSKEFLKKNKKLAGDMLEELYALDYEDTIGDIKCRFKYKNVEADSYGLNASEIILADDSELNKYVGLRKLSAYAENNSTANSEGSEFAMSKKRKRFRASLRDRLKEEQRVAAEKGKTMFKEALTTSVMATSNGVDGQEQEEHAQEEEEQQAQEEGAGEGKKKRKRRKSAPAEVLTKDSAAAANDGAATSRAEKAEKALLKEAKRAKKAEKAEKKQRNLEQMDPAEEARKAAKKAAKQRMALYE